jgi:imidazolonepropionase
MEIHAAGGGIHYTVNHTSKASEKELLISLKERLANALKCGTTTIEAKSGYGLQWAIELKLLKVLTECKHDLNYELKPDMSITYLGAHAIPK